MTCRQLHFYSHFVMQARLFSSLQVAADSGGDNRLQKTLVEGDPMLL